MSYASLVVFPILHGCGKSITSDRVSRFLPCSEGETQRWGRVGQFSRATLEEGGSIIVTGAADDNQAQLSEWRAECGA